MSSDTDDEYFSADSLESEEPKKEMPKNIKRTKKRRTYSELNQIYALRELTKSQSNKNQSNSNESMTKESIKYPTRNSSKEFDEVSKAHQTNRQQTKTHRNLWTGYQKKFSVIESSQKLQKRIEYGRKMSSMNRINQQCQKLHKKLSGTDNSHQNHTTDSRRVSKSISSIVETTKTHSKALKSSSSKDSNVNKDEKLELKLECMQIRHQNDRRKVEKMRSALMNVKSIAKDENGENVE